MTKDLAIAKLIKALWDISQCPFTLRHEEVMSDMKAELESWGVSFYNDENQEERFFDCVNSLAANKTSYFYDLCMACIDFSEIVTFDPKIFNHV